MEVCLSFHKFSTSTKQLIAVNDITRENMTLNLQSKQMANIAKVCMFCFMFILCHEKATVALYFRWILSLA